MTSLILNLAAMVALSLASYMLGRSRTLKLVGDRCVKLTGIGKEVLEAVKDDPPSHKKLRAVLWVDSTMDAVTYIMGLRPVPKPLDDELLKLLDDSVSSNP